MKTGKINKLKISDQDDNRYYLEDDSNKKAYLKKDELTESLIIGDEIEVFIYTDAEDHFVASVSKPYVQLEEFAFLKVKSVNKFGAFIDWGLSTDLLVPFSEQTGRLIEENWYLFFLLIDEKTGRLIASRKLNEFVFFDKIDVNEEDEVDLLCYDLSDLGMNVIVNNLYKGLIFSSDIHKNVNPGDKIKGFVKQVREDGKIDIVLELQGYKKTIDKNAQIILTALKERDGILELNDKSNPEDVKQILGLSKKSFKKGLGYLYKQKLIEFHEKTTRLVK
jgi:predicted RNA-binding protein (virulence factor B family)